MPNPASTSPPQPSPPAEEEPALEATPPGFKSPPPPRPPDPLPPEATIHPPTSNGEADSVRDGGPDELDSATSSPSGPSTTSSPASIDPTFFVEVARTAVGIVSLGVGWLRARRHGPAIAQAWVADEDDQASIGDPLGRIAARRVPAVAGTAAPDVVDGIEAVMGTVGYGLKHAKNEAELITHIAAGEPIDQEEPTQ
jgi:hypothetical protein